MDLEMPLDATAASSPWTWAAVLVAALTLWGFRAMGTKPNASCAAVATSSSPCELTAASTSSSQPEPPAATQNASEPIPAGTPRARFTVYYCSSSSLEARRDYDAGDISDEDREDAAEKNARVGERRCGASTAPGSTGGADWAMLKRQGDLGWYRYQDAAALDGSVVRLWDGGRSGRFASPATRMVIKL